MLRVPAQSIRGATNQTTRALGKLVVLDELDRQARIFHASFADAVEAADGNDADTALRHIQSALFAGIVVDRILRQNGKLRSALGLAPDPPRLAAMRAIRDHMEHFDERLSRALKSPDALTIVDWYLTDRVLVTSSPDSLGRGGRAFSPNTGLLFYDDQVVDMFDLDLGMLEFVQLVRKFRQEVRDTIVGPNKFGGGVVGVIDARDGARAEWEFESAKLWAAMPEVPEEDPVVRLWMEIADPASG